MALRQANRVKTITASGGGDLEADVNESFFIKDIICAASSSDDYFTLRIEGKTVYSLRVKGLGGDHCPDYRSAAYPGLLKWFRERGIELGIPIAAGQKFTLSRYAETGEAHIIYDQGDANQFKATDVNGSESKVKRLISYGTYDAAVAAAGVFTLNKILSPSEIMDFPWGKPAPSNAEIKILALGGCPVSEGDGSQSEGRTTYLKLILEGFCLSDDDQTGWVFDKVAATANSTVYEVTKSIIGPLTENDPEEPLLFNPPILVSGGQELDVQVVMADCTGGNFLANQLDVWLIMEISKR